MNVLVTDDGFSTDDFQGRFATHEDLAAGSAATALDLPSDVDPRILEGRLDALSMIRVDFPSFADGRLRAKGHVLADQYAMARRAGFDEVEIDADLARRQPEDQWRARADWRAHDYRSRLVG